MKLMWIEWIQFDENKNISKILYFDGVVIINVIMLLSDITMNASNKD